MVSLKQDWDIDGLVVLLIRSSRQGTNGKIETKVWCFAHPASITAAIRLE
jgi:hypothetical protein